jgi:hypothetical protein
MWLCIIRTDAPGPAPASPLLELLGVVVLVPFELGSVVDVVVTVLVAGSLLEVGTLVVVVPVAVGLLFDVGSPVELVDAGSLLALDETGVEDEPGLLVAAVVPVVTETVPVVVLLSRVSLEPCVVLSWPFPVDLELPPACEVASVWVVET